MRKLLFIFILGVVGSASAQNAGMALSPARFELEMEPGTETTVVLNLDYRADENSSAAARIVATLNDWNITRDGRVEYFPANTQANSASPWLIYTPGEASVRPGTVHQVRVTVSVPANATPGDHLTALVIEQRPETLRVSGDIRQMIVKYRMASVFYIKVKGLIRKGDLGNLLAESTMDAVVVTPTLKNDGNSMVRPVGSLKILDADGRIVADRSDIEMLPVLAGAETRQPLQLENALPVGVYTVRYRVDFQDGKAAIEGVTDLTVRSSRPQIAETGKALQRP